MNAFTIKDLENLTGIKAHTIRIWEQRYHFLKPQRTQTNIRYYSNDELKTLLNIALLNKYGFKISHIDRMTESEIRDRINTLTDAQAQQERVINDLVQAMVDLDLDRIEKSLNGFISTKGMERTITQIIFPFLEKIGILWLTGHINPAQEHLVTNLIRQKLIVAIDSVHTSIRVDKCILFFLPEGEHHELGLLFVHYLMKSRGVQTIYLGANVPIRDLGFILQFKKPDLIFSHLTATTSSFQFDRFLTQLSQHSANIPVIISGQLAKNYKKSPPEGITFKQSLQEVMEAIG